MVKASRPDASRLVALIAAVFSAAGFGCAGPGPVLFPVVPTPVSQPGSDRPERLYDTDDDGQADCRERLGADGRVVSLGYDTNANGQFDLDVDLGAVPPAQCRDLIVVLDSVPFAMVQELRSQGRFRLFHPPCRIISPFPVMTDPCLSEFFGTSPCPGVESEYFDGEKLTNGYDTYLHEGNVPWEACVDYRLSPAAHPFAYFWPQAWYGHELRRIQDLFYKSASQNPQITPARRRCHTGVGTHSKPDQGTTAGYVVSTSALGARNGRDGHQIGLVQLDRFCQSIVFQSRGQVRITLLSDHGHYLGPSRRIDLTDLLADLGYRVHHTLEKPGDVVVPEFGIVTYASIYTRAPAQVARDVVGLEGIDLAAYRDGTDAVIVLGQSGRARITRSPAGFRYEPDFGDPLELVPIFDRLRGQDKVSPESFVDDRVLFEATVSHVYPDAVSRLWRAFHGLFQHTPDVMVSTQDGWHCGSPTMSSLLALRGSHGNLRLASSSGFAMTTAGELPAVLRMADLRGQMRQLGVVTTEQAAGMAAAGSAMDVVSLAPPAASGGIVK